MSHIELAPNRRMPRGWGASSDSSPSLSSKTRDRTVLPGARAAPSRSPQCRQLRVPSGKLTLHASQRISKAFDESMTLSSRQTRDQPAQSTAPSLGRGAQ